MSARFGGPERGSSPTCRRAHGHPEFEQVELRAQVGGTLTGMGFKDGDIVHRGDLLFTIDARPYEIRLAQANAQLESATARLVLADRELARDQALKRDDFGTAQNVDQRTADLRGAQASVDDAKFDIEHCSIMAPFAGRIGRHLVSVGNLIAGSSAATSPTTLLATLVSLDPIHLDFDMSESNYLAFSREHAKLKVSAVLTAPSSITREVADSDL